MGMFTNRSIADGSWLANDGWEEDKAQALQSTGATTVDARPNCARERDQRAGTNLGLIRLRLVELDGSDLLGPA